MKSNFKNLEAVFAESHCAICSKPLVINDDAINGMFKIIGDNLICFDEKDSTQLSDINIYNNQALFYNKELRYRLQVTMLELHCSEHNYRHTFSMYFDTSKRQAEVSRIVFDEEDIFLDGEEKSYWVRNCLTSDEMSTKISCWDTKKEYYPKCKFDLDIMEDLSSSFRLETQWVRISSNKENLLQKIESLVIFA